VDGGVSVNSCWRSFDVIFVPLTDLAVGAPYDNFQRGAVYIYHGSADGIVPKYVQV
jgi:hypothetical protein